ncbi:MAG: hypothetical protein H8E42_05505 [Nitrospinae bacterium]|nr:hypothetical protein [Nitrospinota bacterium]MBL7018922.1 hypothetical protein [Nitrospinaceae bacterium]
MTFHNKTFKAAFFGTVLIILAGNVYSLFFYANLIPLHVDEGRYFFHFTNTSFQNRFELYFQYPVHSLTIYLAKASLWIFGKNGIGWRLPVILFSVLSGGILFYFVCKTVNSFRVATLALSFLFLNPFFIHYSHELRGYPSLFFFAVCSYALLWLMFERKKQFGLWLGLLISLLACYAATISALMFFFVFLSVVWVLRLLEHFSYFQDHLKLFKNINIKHLFVFSSIFSIFVLFIVFKVDYKIITAPLDDFGGKPINLIALPDFFSAFLGYRYLDDPASELFRYPLVIWLMSLTFFTLGWLQLFRDKNLLPILFLGLFIVTAGIYIFSGKWIPMRSSVYLLPFICIFWAYGLDSATQIIAKRLPSNPYGYSFPLLTIILILYFSFFSWGKYKNTNAESGNPYESTLHYLKANSSPNDLIISTTYETLSEFYFGDFIRQQTKNIYEGGKLTGIYYVTPKSDEKSVPLSRAFRDSAQIKPILDLGDFKLVASFVNGGVRPSEVNIFKMVIKESTSINLNHNALSSAGYFGNYGVPCENFNEQQGLRLQCEKTFFACADRNIDLVGIKKEASQLVIFNAINDYGTKHTTSAFFNSLGETFDTGLLNNDFFKDTYLVNSLTDPISNLDTFKKNVEFFVPTIQQVQEESMFMLCLGGKLFNRNSLIKGLKIFQF